MRPVSRNVVADLTVPGAKLLASLRREPADPARHRELIHSLPVFRQIEQRQSPSPSAWTGGLTVAALNAQRLRRPAAVAGLIREAQADVTLVSEADLGMARSGNRHTVREVATALAAGYLYGVEFMELDLGNPHEIHDHAGQSNAASLHGNGIVSRLTLEDPHLIPLEENGLWFRGRDGAQRRVGGRMAVAARIREAPRPLWVIGLHLESQTDAPDRQRQIQALLRAIDQIAPHDACVIGGDFNTKAIPADGITLDHPERHEPLFGDLTAAGFSWAAANCAEPTQRTGPDGKGQPPFRKLDWLVTRGLHAEAPQVVPSLDADGQPLSDHEMLTVKLSLL